MICDSASVAVPHCEKNRPTTDERDSENSFFRVMVLELMLMAKP